MTISTIIKRSLILIASIIFFAIGIDVDAATAATFFGKDSGVNVGDARPNADKAASQFDDAISTLGAIDLINFEDLTFTSFPTSIPGVMISGSGYSIGKKNSPLTGFNTTPGGTQYLATNTNNTITLTFDHPIKAFGAYINGLEMVSREIVLQFNDGSHHSYNLSILLGNSQGGAGFFGFTEADQSIESVSFTSEPGTGGDFYGIDDIRLVSSSNLAAPGLFSPKGASPHAIPTPTLLPGLIGMGLGIWRKRKQKRKTAKASSKSSN